MVVRLVKGLLILLPMKVRGIKINYILNVTRTILSTLIGLVTLPYINKTLGVDYVGKIEYINSIISYFILFSALGIPMYGIREIAKVRDKPAERTKITIELVIILLFTTFISYLILFGVIISLETFHDYKTLILILCPTILLTNLGLEWFFQGIEDQMYITVRFIIIKVITLVLLFTLVKQSTDYLIYAAILVFTTVGANIFNFFYIRKFIVFKSLNWKDLNFKRHLKGVLTVFLATISISIYIQLDNTLLGIYGGDKYVGLYATANKLIRFVILFVTTLGAVMLPRLSYLFDNNQIENYNTYLEKSLKYILFFSIPLTVIIFMLSKEIIMVMAGEQFKGSILSMQILSPLIVIIGLAYFLAFMVLYPQGKEKIYTIIVFVSAVLSVILNMVFIPKYFHIATSYVSVIVELVGVLLMIIATKEQLKKIGFFSRSNLYYFIGSVLICIMINIVSSYVLETWSKIFISSLLSLVVYLTFLYLMKDIILIENVDRIKNFFKAKSN